MFPNSLKSSSSISDTTSSSTSIKHRFMVMLGCTYPALSLFRIGLGSLVTIELLLRFRYLHAFYSNDGTLPLNLLLFGNTTKNKVDDIYQSVCFLHCHYGELYQQQLLLGMQVVLSIAMTMGVVGCNIICCFSWYFYFTLTLRNTWLNYILDRYIHYLLFLSILLPLTECYSVRSYLRTKSANRHDPSKLSSSSSSISKHTTTTAMNDWYISPATITLKAFLFWIYLDAGYGKYLNQGWSYDAFPLPALDTYARHTIVAQYITTIIGGTAGWRLLTPTVVYIELLAVPVTFFGLFVYNATIVYTGIILISSLHLGIAATIRNASLLSFVAITPWAAMLPIVSSRNKTNTNEQTTTKPRVSIHWCRRSTTIGSLIFLIPMIVGCIWFETMSRSCDQSVTHIWSTLLHNRWNVFIGAEEYVTWEIAPGLLTNGATVDIWNNSPTINWNLPTIQSGGVPPSSTSTSRPGRWRSFPYLADFVAGSDEYHALWGYLCKEWDMKHTANHEQLVKYNFFMLQADVLPNMQFSATRKRLIVSYDCADAYSNRSRDTTNSMTHNYIDASNPVYAIVTTNSPNMLHEEDLHPIEEFPKASDVVPSDEPEQIESRKSRIELSPEPDFPKTTTTLLHTDDEPERSRVTEHRIELIPESDFPKASPDAIAVKTQPELVTTSSSSSECRIELSPEVDFPKTSVTVDATGTNSADLSNQPEHGNTISDCRIELSPEPDFPKTTTITTTSSTNEPEVGSVESEIRIELAP